MQEEPERDRLVASLYEKKSARDSLQSAADVAEQAADLLDAVVYELPEPYSSALEDIMEGLRMIQEAAVTEAQEEAERFERIKAELSERLEQLPSWAE